MAVELKDGVTPKSIKEGAERVRDLVKEYDLLAKAGDRAAAYQSITAKACAETLEELIEPDPIAEELKRLHAEMVECSEEFGSRSVTVKAGEGSSVTVMLGICGSLTLVADEYPKHRSISVGMEPEDAREFATALMMLAKEAEARAAQQSGEG